MGAWWEDEIKKTNIRLDNTAAADFQSVNFQPAHVEIKTPNWELRIVMGAMGLLAIAVITWIVSDIMWWVAILLCGAFAAQLVIKAVGNYKAQADQATHDNRRTAAETLLIEAEASRAEAENQLLLEQIEQEKQQTDRLRIEKYVFDLRPGVLIGGGPEAAAMFDLKNMTFIPASAGERREMGLIQPAGADIRQPNETRLIPLIRGNTCLCFFGVRGTAKTSTAYRWLEARPGNKLVLDPKEGLNYWPDSCQVVTDPEMMEREIVEFLRLMHLYRGQGKIRREPYTLFVDEVGWMRSQHGFDTMPYLMDIAFFGREYGFHAAFTTQGRTVAHLKIDEAGLLENFLVVQTRVRNTTDFYCNILNGDTPADTELLAPAAAPKPVPQMADDDEILQAGGVVDLPKEAVKVQPDNRTKGRLPLPERRAIKAARIIAAGKGVDVSWRKLTDFVFGGKFGTHYNKKIIQILSIHAPDILEEFVSRMDGNDD